MSATTTKKAAAGSWYILPLEIRLLILKEIEKRKRPGWSILASVCCEWQEELEKANFRKLKIGPGCLPEFDAMVARNRHLVRHIFLEVPLAPYPCICCCSCPCVVTEDGSVVDWAIQTLCSLLQDWEPQDAGLALELNISCISDRQHGFKNLYFSSEQTEDEEDEVSSEDQHAAEHSDQEQGWATDQQDDWDMDEEAQWITDPQDDWTINKQHGWLGDQQVSRPLKDAARQLFRHVSSSRQYELPYVDAVTCFIIRRQLRRRFSYQSLGQLFQRLHRLKRIVLELWEGLNTEATIFDQSAMAHILGRMSPKSLESLCLYQDTCTDYNIIPPIMVDVEPRPAIVEIANTFNLAMAVAAKSRSLRNLSAARMVNAEDFFGKCSLEWTWPHLETLTLSTRQLRRGPERQPLGMGPLLRRAAVVARRMPKLRTLVIWNWAAEGHACAFIFRTGIGGATISWRGTWNMHMCPRVLGMWEQTAEVLSPCGLRGVTQDDLLNTEDIQSIGDAIHHLDLPCRVIEPASLWQIRREARLRVKVDSPQAALVASIIQAFEAVLEALL